MSGYLDKLIPEKKKTFTQEESLEIFHHFLDNIQSDYYYSYYRAPKDQIKKNRQRLSSIRLSNVTQSFFNMFIEYSFDGMSGYTLEDQLKAFDTYGELTSFSQIPFSFNTFSHSPKHFSELAAYDNVVNMAKNCEKNHSLVTRALIAIALMLEGENYATIKDAAADEEALAYAFVNSASLPHYTYDLVVSLTSLFKLSKKIQNEFYTLNKEKIELLVKAHPKTRTEFEVFFKKLHEEKVSLQAIAQPFSKAFSVSLSHDPHAHILFTHPLPEACFSLPIKVMKEDPSNFLKIAEYVSHADVTLTELAGFIHSLINPRSFSRSGNVSALNKIYLKMFEHHDATSVIKFISDIIYYYNEQLPSVQDYTKFFCDTNYDLTDLIDPTWIFALMGHSPSGARGKSRELIAIRTLQDFKKEPMIL